jgi:diguanylate cyclase (GGDEF)-like protein
MSNTCFAWKSDDRVDALFKILDDGGSATPQEINGYLMELEKLIPVDDIARQKKLLTFKCWNQDSETEAQKNLAVKFAVEQEAIYASEAPSDTHLELLLCKGFYLQQVKQFDAALVDYDRGIKEAYQLENPKLIADALSLRGSMLSYQGNFTTALENLITAQHLYENLNLTYWANNNLHQLATSYRRLGDPQTALDYLLKLEQAYLDNHNHDEAMDANLQVAFALEELEQHSQALEKYQRSYQYWKNKSNPLFQHIISVHLAGSLIKLGRVDEALSYLLTAEEYLKIEEDNAFSFMHLHFSQAYLIKNEPQKALEHLALAEPAFKISNNQRGLIELYYQRALVLAGLNQWQQAYLALSHYTERHLEQDKSSMSMRTTEMRTRFDVNKIEKENSLLIEKQEQKEIILQALTRNESLQNIIIALVGLILLIVSVFAYVQLKRKLRFKQLALTDELTELANRRHCYAQANILLKDAIKQRIPFAIISFDIDHFKRVNDQWGHDVGDKVLITMAGICTNLMRKSDIIGRVGGEEFLVVLPNANKEQALEIAERIVTSVAQAQWQHLTPGMPQTISAGVTSLTKETALAQLLLKADQGLYSAKSAGRNCVRQV